MTDDEAQSTGEFQMRHSHATHDLYNAIAAGDYPGYDLYIQTMDPAQEASLDFDPLDCTKVSHPLLRVECHCLCFNHPGTEYTGASPTSCSLNTTCLP